MKSHERQLKVAFVHQPWSVIVPPMRYADSVGIWTDEVARRLTDACQVISYSRRGGDQSAEQQYDGVTYRRFAAPLDRAVRFLRFLDEWKLLNPTRGFMASKWFYRQFYSQVARDLTREQPDIIHIQNFSQFALLARRSCPKAKIVLHMHSEWLTEYSRKLIAPRIATADAVLTCSNYFRDSVREGWPEHADKCRTVYNGVELRDFAASASHIRNGRRLLFVGRVCPDKGVHILIKAFAKVLDRFPDAQLAVVGPVLPNYKAVSVNLSKEPAVRELSSWYHRPFVPQLKELMTPAETAQVQITGEVSREALVTHYREADVLVLPSIYAEGFGIPIVEAAALGTPTVASRRGGVPEVVVDGSTGILVEPGDVDALANALLRLMENPAERLAMGAAARQRTIDHFTWDRIAQSLLNVYWELMQLPEPRPVLFPESQVSPLERRRAAEATPA